MSAHTPGPWAVEGSGVSAHHAANDKRCQYWICDQVNGDRRPDATTGRPSDNARLIAAAPELLAALQGYLAMDVYEKGPDWYEAMRSAVAKATGAPP